jgi:type II secretory pathway pseudopilin PulG
VAAIVAILAIALAISFQRAPDAAAHSALDRFMYALGQVESGGSYTARNPTSGAYGKYQIMPYNWGPWALKYLGNAGAYQSPKHQEIVARAKVHDLYHWLGTYRRTAYWWLTGSTKTTGWTAYATRYVLKVIGIHKATLTVPKPAVTVPKPAITATPARTVKHYTENSSRITYTGAWPRAEHAKYMGDVVRQARSRGQTATFRFSGSQVAWNGPKGPTRGKAQVWLDGVLVKTVDLYASRFAPRNRIYTRSFAKAGQHTLLIKVLGTRGRPVVAIDELIVWP